MSQFEARFRITTEMKRIQKGKGEVDFAIKEVECGTLLTIEDGDHEKKIVGRNPEKIMLEARGFLGVDDDYIVKKGKRRPEKFDLKKAMEDPEFLID
jgi:hypothetical protein